MFVNKYQMRKIFVLNASGVLNMKAGVVTLFYLYKKYFEQKKALFK